MSHKREGGRAFEEIMVTQSFPKFGQRQQNISIQEVKEHQDEIGEEFTHTFKRQNFESKPREKQNITQGLDKMIREPREKL